MTIRLLDSTLINQMAAGEVVERPASAVKELVENAIDADATHIEISLREGGKTYLSVTDNGKGMTREDLERCVDRHTTSKMPHNNLFQIETLGFRGEALASIASVSRVTLTTRSATGDAWQMIVEGGQKSSIRPAVSAYGTKIEVRDLFYAVPARLKFLKSSQTEKAQIVEGIQRLGLMYPEISFVVKEKDRVILSLETPQDRIQKILGQEFWENSVPFSGEKGSLVVRGRMGLPTYSQASTGHQYFFVNGRVVKDRLLSTAVRIGYQDVLASGRQPALCLFLVCAPSEVDVNVHPSKSEVRFQDAHGVRSLVSGALRNALSGYAGLKTAPLLGQRGISAFQKESLGGEASLPHSSHSSSPLSAPVHRSPVSPGSSSSFSSRVTPSPDFSSGLESSSTKFSHSWGSENPKAETMEKSIHTSSSMESKRLSEEIYPLSLGSSPPSWLSEGPLGQAKAQIHETYIVSETPDHLILVDQHAAHERLVYETLKSKFLKRPLIQQTLLIPYSLSLSFSEVLTIESHLSWLEEWGIRATLEKDTLTIESIPSLLQGVDVGSLIRDLLSELHHYETQETLEMAFCDVLAERACKNSIRAGRRLSLAEMNALLRQMESTSKAAQCNHGRPTFIRLDKSALNRLFGRE